MLGVRWSDPSLGEQLGSIADTFRGVGEAPPNVSVVVGESSGRSRVKHHLYVQGVPLVVSADDSRLIRATIRVLATLAVGVPAGVPPLHTTLVLRADGETIAVDRRLSGELQRLEPRLRRTGARIIDVPSFSVVGGTNEIRLPDAASVVGVGREELQDHWPLGAGDDDLRGLLSRISTVVVLDRANPDSIAGALAAVAPIAAGLKRGLATTDVRALLPLVERAKVVAVHADTRHALRSALGI